ncbi:MAG: 30S ribosomal protein S19 [Halobacteriota archaeon]|nr:30S ribosomal protein S19 [Halobacteriota archaeon]
MAKKRKSDVGPRRKGEFTYRGHNLEKLKKMNLDEISELLPSKQRRKLKRGLTKEEEKFVNRLKKTDGPVKTHLRDMIVLPEMIGKTIEIHDGRRFNRVEIQPEMIGHHLGEFALTRNRVSHGSAGIGATRSSKFIPLK